MLNIYRSDDQGKLQEVDEIQKGCWVNAIHPTEEEISYLVNTLQLDLDFIQDPLDDEERSRIEKEDDKLLIIVDIPMVTHEENGDSIYDTIPVGIIILPDLILTICLKDNPIFERFINQRVKNFYTYMKTRFALQILQTISSYYLRYLKQINRKTDQLEQGLHKSLKNEELFSLLTIEKSLVYFTTSLKANRIVLQKLLSGNLIKMYEDDEDLLEDVLIDNKQAIEMAETYNNILNGMMDAFGSVISNNLNNVMKFLTTVTLLMSIWTVITGFFGMNVTLPLTENNPYAYVIIIGICIVLSGIVAFIFWKRRYF
ncbi:MAG: magnesium transporter CorA family protein [Bacillaceae bacterium]